MDKGRHPHVIRTWTVERTKTPYRPPQPVKPSPDPRPMFRGPAKHPSGPGSTPDGGSKQSL